MVCAVMGYPDEEAELAILAGQSKGRLLDRVRPVAGQADLLAMQQEVSTVFVHELMYRYIVALAQASRKDPRLAVGLSPVPPWRWPACARGGVPGGAGFCCPAGCDRCV